MDEGEDRRRHPRAPIGLAVSLRFDSVQHFLSAYAEDISLGGMLLRSEHAVDAGQRRVGEVIALRFDAGDQRIVEGNARIVRIVHAGTPGEPAGLGLEFLDLSPQARKLVDAIVRIKLATPHPGR